MTHKHFIESAVFFVIVSIVSSTEIDLEILRNFTGSPDDNFGREGNNLALNLYNVSLHINSFHGNKISLLQTSNPNSGSSDRCIKSASEGVFWRPWTGTVPKDAIVGGMKDSLTNVSIYMGQMVLVYKTDSYLGGVQPVMIYSNSISVTASFWGLHVGTKNINILCASDPKLVTWRPVSSTQLSRDNEDLVVAGVENYVDGTLFFGRTIHNKEIIIGKVLLANNVWKLYFPYMGSEFEKTTGFEILTYNKIDNQEAIPEPQ